MRGLLSKQILLITIAGFMEAILYGMSFPFFALTLEDRGLSATLIGINAAIGALAVFVVGPVVPPIIVRVGYRIFAVACFAASVLTLLLLLLSDSIILWFVVRGIMGFASGCLWIITEAWINDVVDNEKRGRVVSFYQMIYSVGFLLGPSAMLVVGYSGAAPIIFLIVVAILGGTFAFLVACLPVSVTEDRAKINWRVAWRARDLLIVALICGMVETGLYTLLPIFGTGKGLVRTEALGLLVAFSVGAIGMALPLGWAADKFDRQRLLRCGSIIATVSVGLLVPLGSYLVPAWFLSVLAGGTIIGLFNLTLVILGERYTGTELPVAAAGYSMAYALGCAIGAASAGFTIDLFGVDGLPALGCILLLGYVIYQHSAPTFSRVVSTESTSAK